MLNSKQLSEIRELLEASQNPLFFFDNDVDGLASFLLLRKFLGRGKGVAIKSFPDLNVAYLRKVYELKPDSIFVLDKPIISEEFLLEVKKLSIPVTWIDHHPPQKVEGVHYFNPLKGRPATSEPVSFWTYKVSARREDEWVALLGCVADWFIPGFAADFAREHLDLVSEKDVKEGNVGRILYDSEFGKLIKILSFALKDRTSYVVRMIRYLFTVKSPYELLRRESREAEFIYNRFERVNRHYTKLIERARRVGLGAGRVLFFQYFGTLSLSSDISNELIYLFPDKFVVVAYPKGEKINISLRHNKLDLRKALKRIMKGIDGSGGGHEHACGAVIPPSELDKFKRNLFEFFG